MIHFISRNLSEDLTTDKIAEIRAKLISNRRTRIKPEDEDSKTQSLVLGDLEVGICSLIFIVFVKAPWRASRRKDRTKNKLSSFSEGQP